MTTEYIEFGVSKNLLEDVITKQTGSPEKAIQELWQNSRDAKRKDKDLYVEITLNTKSIMFKDNGTGMTEEIIRKQFTVFGDSDKRDDEDSIGRFAMGRGQIMNFGVCLWVSGHNVIVVDLRKGLGYTLYKRKQFVEGTTFVCVFFEEFSVWRLNRVENHLRIRLLPEPHYYIYLNNSVLVSEEFTEYPEFTDETFRVFQHPHAKSYLYAQGIFIKTFKSNFTYSINVLTKAEVNMARNEFLETDSIYDELRAKMNEVEALMITNKTTFDKQESRLTLSFLRDGRVPLQSLLDKRIVLTADNRLVSLNSLKGKEVMFGETNIWSDDCIHRGYSVLHYDNQSLLRRIFKIFTALEITSTWTEPKEIAKRGYFRSFDITKISRNQAYAYIGRDMNEKLFLNMPSVGYKRKVSLGESDIRMAWTNGRDFIKINKNVIIERHNKEEICTAIWTILCHEYAHHEPSKEEDYHDDDFYQRFHDFMFKTAQRFANYMKKLTPKYLKDRYINQPIIE